MLTREQIDETIASNLDKLRKLGVLTVRPGYEIAGGKLTGRRAIIATVYAKKAVLPASERLPESIEGVPVDVREVGTSRRHRTHAPGVRKRRFPMSLHGQQPDSGLEREMPSGRLLSA